MNRSPHRRAGCPSSPELSVGEVARRSGVAVSALRFYEQRGRITSRRNAGNQRRYPREVIRRLSVIKAAQRIGVPLVEIRQALSALPETRTPAAADRQRMSDQWKSALVARIERLVKLRDQLGECIGCGCLSLASCPLRNPGDALSREGSGARLLDPA